MLTISIIITATYNAAPTIADCLRSVASQTHPAAWEVNGFPPPYPGRCCVNRCARWGSMFSESNVEF